MLFRPVLLLGLLAACADTSGSTSRECRPLAQRTAARTAPWTGSIFTIVMENKSRNEIIGNNDAPYINWLAAQGAQAAGYHDPFVHPSEPNYIWMVAGENFGVLDDDDPSGHHIASTSHIADQIEAAGLTWRSYQESMGEPCGTSSHGTYAAKHNPFVYFNDVNGWDGQSYNPSPRCNDHVVDYSQLATDLEAGTVPSYVFITPNLDNDMHDGSIARGDHWLSHEIPQIMASPAFTEGGVLFLLWDEGGGLITDDDPPFIVVSPNSKQGFVSQTDYDTSSYLKTVQTLLGLEHLPCDADPASVSTMDDLFTQSMPAPHDSNTAEPTSL